VCASASRATTASAARRRPPWCNPSVL
jgi:hypothetical protein